MNTRNRAQWMLCAGLFLTRWASFGQDAPATPGTTIKVDAGKVLNRVSPWLAGSCIEDVNHEIYGGLYDQKLFGESFEEPSPSPTFRGWSTLGGDWESSGRAIKVAPNQGAKLVSELPPFRDGSVSVDLTFARNSGGNAGLLLRVSDAKIGADAFNGYEVSLDPLAQRVILGKHRNNWQPLQSAAVTFEPTQSTRLKVELAGSRISIYVGRNSVPIIDFIDPDAPLLSGTFALRNWGADVAFAQMRLQKAEEAEQTILLGEVAQPVPDVSGQWDRVRNGTADAGFMRDATHPYNGAWSQKIEIRSGNGTAGVANRGLNRWGISIKRGQRLEGRLYLRSRDLRGEVRLTLQSSDGTRTYATQTIRRVGQDWAKHTISLTPNADDPKAKFVVSIAEQGALWIDQATLTGTGAAQFKGLPIRADIALQMQQQGIKFLRYGGTMVNAPEYRWKKMIGDPDKRPPYRGHWYPYSTNAFGIEEFLRFCQAAGFEPAFAINVEETPQDMADMVEYLNGPTSTPWGRRRAESGHPKPYNVRWIEIGNEEVIWGDIAADYDHYIDRFNLLSAAMVAKDPSLQLVCAAWWRPESPNMERVFKALQGKAAYWDLHVWSDDARAGTTIDRDLKQMQALFKQWVPSSTMKCVILEENGNLHNQQRALGHATTLNAVRRHGDFVPVSCPANALQPLGQNDNGWNQGQIFFTPDRVWGMPPFYSAQMATENHQPLHVASEVDGDVDVTATRSEDGKTLVLHVVNTGAVAQKANVNIAGMSGIRSSARKWTLAGELRATNTAMETRVNPIETFMSGTGPRFSVTLPPTSYTIIRLNGSVT